MSSPECLIRSFVHCRRLIQLVLAVAVLAVVFTLPSRAQANPAQNSDVIVFTNGDQLTGKLLRVLNGTVTFHSDTVGDVTVTWDKVKSLRTSHPFAVIQQGQKISRRTPASAVSKGAIDVENQQILVNAGPGGSRNEIATKNAQYLIDEDTYTKEVQRNPGFRHGWAGSVTAGASQIEATQNSRTFTAAVAAARAVPSVTWLPPQSRTLFNFNADYGSLSSPNTPTVKTEIIQGNAEQDWYVSPRFYTLALASFDHDYSQGLDLQQIYGGGFGYTVFKTPRQELDVKADLHFERQSFGHTPGIFPPVTTPSKNLVGLDVGDTYQRMLPHGMGFQQGLVLTPAFNEPSAFSAILTAALTFPVYKRLSFSLSALDDYLNDPAVGSKKNSFQYTAGITYTF